jgi:hypothetical protein
MKYIAPCLPLVLLGGSVLAGKPAAPPPAPPPLPAVLAQTERPKMVSQGTFRDSQGGVHPWSVTQAHALQWDSTTYLPVGGLYTPQCWAQDATADAWDADKKVFDDWKAHGVGDVCLSAGKVGLTHVPVQRVQQVLDYLEGHGFHYGIEIADFPKDPLVGYVIKPGVYRDPAPPTVGPARFGPIPGLADAFYMLVSRHEGEIDDSGTAQITGGDTAVVDLKNSSPDDVLLLYPQRLFFDGSPESHLPDLWQGYDEYRDRVLGYLRRVKFGPGFRFFLDPLADHLGVFGEVQNLVPTTDGFRLDFQAWLDKKYHHNADDLNQGWGVDDRSSDSAIPDFETAARCLPLWFEARGIPAIYDPVKHISYAVTNRPRIAGHYWDDLNEFRLESTRGYMNSIADALQKGVADVPVVYQWTGQSALFSNDRTVGGFDGLSVGVGGLDSVTGGAYVYSQAEESSQTSWLLASEAGDANLSRPQLFENWDALRDVGARGFFLATPAPAALDWLNAYAAGVQLSAEALSQSRPHILPYPAGAGLDISSRQLADGVWWLPSYRPGAAVVLGMSLKGYYLPDPDGRLPTYVIWSTDGKPQQAQFDFGKEDIPVFTDPAGAPIKAEKKGDLWTVTVSKDPILISHVRSMPLPQSAAEEAEREAKRLLDLADAQNIDTARFRQQFFYAANTIPTHEDNVNLRYDLLKNVISAVTEVLRPYTWIEAESATKYTFDSLVPDPAASGGAYLSLDTVLPAPHATAVGNDGGYRAEYSFSVNAPGRYTLWMAGSPLGTKDVSAFQYSVDNGVNTEVRGAATEGDTYAGKFIWSNLGDLTLTRGIHKLAVVVLGRRPADDHYALDIDAFCFSRVPFHPDGVHQPPIDILPPPDAPKPDVPKKKRK